MTSYRRYSSGIQEFSVPNSLGDNSIRVITLENGLDVLLMCDPNATSTVCSLSVNSGSNADGGFCGLAHLVEHAILCGSKHYSQPYSLLENVYKSGGYFNAFTTFTQTNYHFEIPVTSNLIKSINPKVKSGEPVLDYIIKQFSDMFKYPLFQSKFISNCINEINEEHLSNVNSNDKKFYHFLKLLCDSNHSFSNFFTGNEETLKKIPKVKKKLFSYFDQNYYAKNMKLVVKSSLSLHSLLKLIMPYFEDIQNSITSNHPLRSVFGGENKLIHIESDESRMRVIFPICELNDRLIQISKIWVDLLGQESKDSLCDYLVKNNHCSLVLVFDQFIDIENLFIIIELHLTSKGKFAIFAILNSIFTYINKIIDTSGPFIDTLIDDFIKSEKIQMIFQDSTDEPLQEVTKWSELLHYVPPKDLFWGYSVCPITSRDFLFETRKWLNFQNFGVLLMCPTFRESEFIKLDPEYKADRYFKSHYCSYLITQLDPLEYPFMLPEKNMFLLACSHAQLDDDIRKISDSTNLFSVRFHTDHVPELLESSSTFELWYKKEYNYNHKIFTTFQLTSGYLQPNCFNFIGINLITELLGPFIREIMYPSEKIECTWSLFATLNSSNSITVNCNGLDFNYMEIFGALITALKVGLLNYFDTLPYSSFMKARVKIRRELENLVKEDLLKQAIALNTYLVEERIYSIEERCEVLESITLNDLKKISDGLLKDVYVSALVNGDLSRDTCHEINNCINYCTGHLSYRVVTKAKEHGSTPPLVGKYSFSHDVDNENNFCYFYLYLGERDNSDTRTISKLLEFIIGSRTVHELKNKRNLGYRASSGLRINRETIGMFIYIESSEYGSEELADNIEDVLMETKEMVKNMTESQLKEEFVDQLLGSLNVIPSISPSLIYDILPDQSSTNFQMLTGNYFEHKSYWEKICNRSYRFRGKHGYEEVDEVGLKSITKDQILKAFDLISPDSSSRCILMVQSSPTKFRRGKKKLVKPVQATIPCSEERYKYSYIKRDFSLEQAFGGIP